MLNVLKRYGMSRVFSKKSDMLADSPSSSALLSYYTAGHNIVAAGRNKIGDIPYTTYITLPADSTELESVQYVPDNVAIYALELPFNTESHFVGLSKNHTIHRLQFETFLAANGMEKIVLEGDFPNYFDIYAPQGQQFAVRTVLEPDAMAYVATYCRSHFWEINSAEMYFVDNYHDNHEAALPVLIQSQQFIAAIKPVLLPGQPGAPVVHHDTPYGVYDGPRLACPICQKMMFPYSKWQACPDGHGILIAGRDLTHLHDGSLKITVPYQPSMQHAELTCPNCKNKMEITAYEGGKTVIDSCAHCPFRWLDASEVAKIAPAAS